MKWRAVGSWICWTEDGEISATKERKEREWLPVVSGLLVVDDIE
jgi:hypothetical protein